MPSVQGVLSLVYVEKGSEGLHQTELAHALGHQAL